MNLERVADRAYILGVLIVGLFFGSYVANRGPNLAEATAQRMNQVGQNFDANMKDIKTFAESTNSRLAVLEQKLGAAAPKSPAKK